MDIPIRANGMFDPYVPLGGTQPGGYDQWAAFYNYYRVRACKIQAVYIPTSAATSTQNIIVIVPVTDLSGAQGQNMPALIQYPYCKKTYTNGNAAGSKFTITSYMSTKKIWGVSRSAIVDDQDFGAPTTANPQREWDWLVRIAPLDSAVTITGFIDLTVTFYTEFYGRKPLGVS